MIGLVYLESVLLFDMITLSLLSLHLFPQLPPSITLTPTPPHRKEFDNTEGEEYQTDLSAVGSPASQTDPEVYVLPLTEVSVPVSKHPSRSGKSLQRYSYSSITRRGHVLSVYQLVLRHL